MNVSEVSSKYYNKATKGQVSGLLSVYLGMTEIRMKMLGQ
jgi:hypothetical protein